MFVGLAALAVALLAGCSGHASPTHPAPPRPPTTPVTSPVSSTTASKTFTPYDASGALIVATTSDATGSCWTTSIALPSPTTFRCIAGNAILDPCFVPPNTTDPKTAACFTDPWSPGVRLVLTAAPPKPDVTTRTTPWALELANGARCVAVTGTVDQVGSVDLRYSCGGAAEAGLPSTPGAALSALYRATDTQALTSVAVRTAWH